MRVLVDTSSLVELERGSQKAKTTFKKLAKHQLCISAVTVSEFLIGAYLSRKIDARKKATDLLNQFTVLNVDVHAAGGAVAMKLKPGARVGWADNIIASTAVTEKCDILLTENKKDFDFPELKGKVKSFADF